MRYYPKTSDVEQDRLIAWGRGEEKLEYVTAWLEAWGLKYDAETIRVAI